MLIFEEYEWFKEWAHPANELGSCLFEEPDALIAFLVNVQINFNAHFLRQLLHKFVDLMVVLLVLIVQVAAQAHV